MKTADALTIVTSQLTANKIPDERLEAEILLAHVLGISRATLYASLNEQINQGQSHLLEYLVTQRLKRKPLAYLLGHREFYGIDLIVSPAVMIPRQDTETLVEQALRLANQHDHTKLTIVDVGTGSGAIAVAIATHLPQSCILATDISLQALNIASANLNRLGIAKRVSLVAGDLLIPISGMFDLILANLPYIRDKDMDTLQEEIRLYEPRSSLAGGQDGLDSIRRLLQQLPPRLNPHGTALFEIHPDQMHAVLDTAKQFLPDAHVQVICDLSGSERVIQLSRC